MTALLAAHPYLTLALGVGIGWALTMAFFRPVKLP